MVKLFFATKAFIGYNGKVLIVKESCKYDEGTNKGFFDVPGGRLRPGEKWEESLKREVKEETGLDIDIGKPFFVNEWRPVVNGEEWQIVGVFFECVSDTNQVTLSEDHTDYAWINPKDYNNYDLILNLKAAFEAYNEKGD